MGGHRGDVWKVCSDGVTANLLFLDGFSQSQSSATTAALILRKLL